MNNATAKPVDNKSPGGQSRRFAAVPTGSSSEHQHDWQDMIATAAYYRAEKRGFEGGSAEQDWYEAETELRERFGQGGGI